MSSRTTLGTRTAFIYLRVARIKQGDTDSALTRQRALCQALAARLRAEVVGDYADIVASEVWA